jgi:hypothetical protein
MRMRTFRMMAQAQILMNDEGKLTEFLRSFMYNRMI